MGEGQGSIATNLPQKDPQGESANQPASRCPADIKTLTDSLLKDLPSYSNRVMQRVRHINKNLPYSYVIVAGRPEFEPLPLSAGFSQYNSQFPNTTEQIFFTTLERRYSHNKAVQMQLYHWLFLVPTDQGWQLLTMFTRIGPPITSEKPPLPPKETSEGITGQAVSLWLRDHCQLNE
ncbi:conserved hypothetical protein [Gloeothece citriformis PCC 7424]|uniref:Uncharacterized protein n=2 Tax=Gloeothece TaxID=28070 RepID=B7KL54_GLOC7|nr:conserved hypothetical protein [Gloeothece citriformis PCC 7424]